MRLRAALWVNFAAVALCFGGAVWCLAERLLWYYPALLAGVGSANVVVIAYIRRQAADLRR